MEAENLEMLRDLAAQLEGQEDSNKAPSNAGKTQRIPKKTGRTATVTSTGHRSLLSRIDEQNEWEDDFARGYNPAMTVMTIGMGFLPYPPQFFPPPHAGFGTPMTMADPDKPDKEIDTEDDLGSPEPVDQDGEGSPEGDLLSVVRERYVDERWPTCRDRASRHRKHNMAARPRSERSEEHSIKVPASRQSGLPQGGSKPGSLSGTSQSDQKLGHETPIGAEYCGTCFRSGHTHSGGND